MQEHIPHASERGGYLEESIKNVTTVVDVGAKLLAPLVEFLGAHVHQPRRHPRNDRRISVRYQFSQEV